MTLNVFSKPSDAFKKALEAPSMISALIIVFLTSILFSGLAFSVTNNLWTTIIIFLSFFINWIVLSVVYWLCSFMFNINKRKTIESNFIGVITAVSRLWLFLILIFIFALISVLGNLFVPLAGIAILVLLLLLLIDSFILMKVILDSNNSRAILAWLLAIILYGLINTIAFALTTFFMTILI